MSATQPTGGFSLFPSSSRPSSRAQQRPAAAAHYGGEPSSAVTPITPDQQYAQYSQQPQAQSHQQQQPQQQQQYEQYSQPPQPEIVAGVHAEHQPVIDPPHRTNTALSDTATLVREGSIRSRNSIAKVRLSAYDEVPPPPAEGSIPPVPGSSAQGSHSQQRPEPLQSIFPQYNPDVPLDQQNYYPTQTSPTRIPRAVISRPLYSPGTPPPEETSPPSPQTRFPEHQLPVELHRPQAGEQSQPQAQSQSQSQSHSQPLQQPQPQPQLQQPQQQPSMQVSSPAGALSLQIPATAPTTNRAWPPKLAGQNDDMRLPTASTTEELRKFWKVANGWKATPAEGRVYCLHMTSDKDSPVYRLSSASQQPFYRLRLDPTSVSAYVTLSRHDPARAFKMEKPGKDKDSGNGEGKGKKGKNKKKKNSSNDNDDDGNVSDTSVYSMPIGSPGGMPPSAAASSSSSAFQTLEAKKAERMARFDSSKNWQEALATTLEEEYRRHPPNDGLVALLYPTPAARMAVQRPGDAGTVMLAERECARLVWDEDSSTYFLVHPALALPFCVTIERSTTWSRTAYTLEHVESPQHLARLTRDATGAGWLEIDTGIAAHIDAVYLVDVAVAALVLVAHSDTQFAQVETFAPSPPAFLAPPVLGGGGSGSGNAPGNRSSLVSMVRGAASGSRSASRMSRSASAADDMVATTTKPAKAKRGKGRQRTRMEEFELDLESQNSVDLSGKYWEAGQQQQQLQQQQKAKKNKKKKDDKDRMPFWLRAITALLKFCFWCLSLVVRAVIAMISGIFRCLTGEKLV